jgi:ABC-type multidrug transport system ATPase subunit
MNEAMRCDRVALIQDGIILAIDAPQNIRDGFSRKLFTVKSSEKYKLIITIRKFPGTISAYPFGDSVHATFVNDKTDTALFDFLNKGGISDAVIEEAEAGIEDRFLELMEKGATV